MIITLMINRQKIGNKIKETFSVYPEHSYCFSNKRAIFYKLWKARSMMSIHKDYKLLSIEDENKQIIYTYEFNNSAKVPKLSESIKINYSPVLGKKYCSKCTNRKLYKGENYCIIKGKKINPKKAYYKCLFWNELEG